MQWQQFLDAVSYKLINDYVLEDKKCNRQSESDFMSCLIANMDMRKLMIRWLDEQFKNRELKSESKAKQLRDLGNKEFQRKDWTGVSLYTQSAQYANPQGEHLSIAVANRSAALYYMDNYRDCLKDIDLAISVGYPKKLQHKLYVRMAQCHLKLKDRKMAETAIGKVEGIVDACDELSEDKKQDIVKEVSFLKSFASKLEYTDVDHETEPSSSRPELAFSKNDIFPYASAALDCKYTPQKGRHVVANRDIQKGQVIFVEKPFAFVILDHELPSTVCRHCCHPHDDVPVPCKSCLNTMYCSIQCLNEAWSLYHKWECPGSQMGIGQQIGIAHLSLKVLFNSTTTEDKERFDEVQRLVTNMDKIPTKDLLVYGITAVMLTTYLSKYTDFFETVDFKKSFSDKFIDKSKDFDCDLSTEGGKLLYVSSFLLRHTLQLICNGHAITKLMQEAQENDAVSTENQNRIATGIYPSASMMNHSCDPNIINSFDDQYLIVKATKDIPAGGEVLNCYGPHFRRMSKEERQESLRNQYCFTCTCEPCTSPELQYFLERFSALKCPECSGAVFKLYASLSCLDCGSSPAINYNAELAEAQNLFDSAQLCIDEEKDAEALNKLKQCLNMRRSVLYKHHEDIINTLDLIGKVYAISGKWLESISYLEHIIAGIEERFGSDSVELGNELNKITDICIQYLQEETNTKTKQYKNALKKTRRLLDRAKQVMLLNYGPWNGGCQEIEKKMEQLSSILKNFNI